MATKPAMLTLQAHGSSIEQNCSPDSCTGNDKGSGVCVVVSESGCDIFSGACIERQHERLKPKTHIYRIESSTPFSHAIFVFNNAHSFCSTQLCWSASKLCFTR